jgi:hypothetical protein
MTHLREFVSTYYALITKEKIKIIDVRIHKCIFMGYSNTTNVYHIYDEVNNNSVLSKDVIFLESTNNEKIVEKKLDHIDNSPCKYISQF